MWAGTYTLDLYCENYNIKPVLNDNGTWDGTHVWNEFPHQYTDEYGSVCRSRARKLGWIIKSDGSAICPKCSGKQRS